MIDAVRVPPSAWMTSQSTKTGVAPVLVTAKAVAIKVLAWTITSSPALIPRDLRTNSMASVPFPQLIEYLEIALQALREKRWVLRPTVSPSMQS